MALLNPRITADVIEANEFPELSQQYRVMAVPKVIINDRVQFEGALPELTERQAPPCLYFRCSRFR